MTFTHPTRPSTAENWLRTHPRSTIAWMALYLGAASLVVSGVDHIDQYYANDYRTVPTIGRLFVLNFVSAVVVAAGLIAPIGRVTRRYADAIRAVLAVAGIGIAVLSLGALFISESSSLFGFTENGYREPIVVAIASEVAAAVFLVVYLVARDAGLRTTRRRPRHEAAFYNMPVSARSVPQGSDANDQPAPPQRSASSVTAYGPRRSPRTGSD
jgi:hypothetical protein